MSKRKEDWEIAEELANQYVNANPTKGSGNQAGDGDGTVLNKYFHEVKYSKNGFKFTKTNLNKTRKQARTHNRIPILTCVTKNEDGKFDMFSALPTGALGDLLNTPVNEKLIDQIMDVFMSNKKVARVFTLSELETLQEELTKLMK